MSRYLTPSKIALLCLISVYTEGYVPNSSAVQILSFLVSFLLPLDPVDTQASSKKWQNQHSVSLSDLEEVLSSHVSSIPGRSVWDLLLKKMWTIDTYDELEAFFPLISSMLVKTREEQLYDRDHGILLEPGITRLSRCSPLGAFVRRAQLEFTRLQFYDSVKLWKGFVTYRLPTFRAWARKNPHDDQDPIDYNLYLHRLDSSSHLVQVAYGNIEEESDGGLGVSTNDIERLLEFQVLELQSSSPRFRC